jgi:hypothetical protein
MKSKCGRCLSKFIYIYEIKIVRKKKNENRYSLTTGGDYVAPGKKEKKRDGKEGRNNYIRTSCKVSILPAAAYPAGGKVLYRPLELLYRPPEVMPKIMPAAISMKIIQHFSLSCTVAWLENYFSTFGSHQIIMLA